MPPRAKSSPAPARPVTPKATGTPAKSPRASKSPSARSKKAAEPTVEDEAVAATSGSGSASAASASTTAPAVSTKSVPAVITEKAKPVDEPQGGPDCYLLLGVVLAIIAIVVACTVGPYDLLSAPKRVVPALSGTAFDGKKLKTSYTGNSLLIFTQSKGAYEVCSHCKAVRDLLSSDGFQKKNHQWYSKSTLRIGRVYCDKHVDLCTTFGVDGSDPNAVGLPHVVSFKGAEEEGKFEGELTLESFTQFALKAQEKDAAAAATAKVAAVEAKVEAEKAEAVAKAAGTSAEAAHATAEATPAAGIAPAEKAADGTKKKKKKKKSTAA